MKVFTTTGKWKPLLLLVIQKKILYNLKKEGKGKIMINVLNIQTAQQLKGTESQYKKSGQT